MTHWTPRRWAGVFFDAGKACLTDNVFKHSAAVSFYTLFSLAPITIIALTVAGLFLGKEAATAQFQQEMGNMIGPASAGIIATAAQASQAHQKGGASTVIGLTMLVVGATSVFGQLQDALNSIWGVRARPDRHSWLVIVIRRLLSFAMVLTIGFLLLVSLVLTTALVAILSHFRGELLASPAVLKFADITLSLGVITVLFALLFKVLPDVKLALREVWLGAFLTAILFTVGRYLIALYLSHSTVASIYGTAGSLVALLIWIYYSCVILLYGVEVTRAYREASNARIEPASSAELVHPDQKPPPRRTTKPALSYKQ
ncbi:MAG TPA: YihY/virulence factor BrkB family protein [Candidatus Didemnitutus sp.]|nr:YihY/virulence factor BrkB family protein [Candidatus Didemnitutus sp.]